MSDNTPLEAWPVTLLNSAQSLADRLNLRPIGCFCGECEPGLTYQCAGCSRIVPYCYGADDELYDYCDHCAANISN